MIDVIPCPGPCKKGTAVMIDPQRILRCDPCGGMLDRYDHPDIRMAPKPRYANDDDWNLQ